MPLAQVNERRAVAQPAYEYGAETLGTPAQGFYCRAGKRAFDAFAAACGLVLLTPLLVLLAMLVRLTSRGPALFRQERVGLHGRRFRLWKFRTMVAGAVNLGPGITASGDVRVTRVGAFLRRTKLDELPQLLNVLRGEMSLVGPRPELPEYVAQYTPQQLQVFGVRPGVTDPASVEYRHEEEILGRGTDPERDYRERILPHKLELNNGYLRAISFRGDLVLIFRTLVSLVSQAGSKMK